jgi:hypothetical protein
MAAMAPVAVAAYATVPASGGGPAPKCFGKRATILGTPGSDSAVARPLQRRSRVARSGAGL